MRRSAFGIRTSPREEHDHLHRSAVLRYAIVVSESNPSLEIAAEDLGRVTSLGLG